MQVPAEEVNEKSLQNEHAKKHTKHLDKNFLLAKWSGFVSVGSLKFFVLVHVGFLWFSFWSYLSI